MSQKSQNKPPRAIGDRAIRYAKLSKLKNAIEATLKELKPGIVADIEKYGHLETTVDKNGRMVNKRQLPIERNGVRKLNMSSYHKEEEVREIHYKASDRNDIRPTPLNSDVIEKLIQEALSLC